MLSFKQLNTITFLLCGILFLLLLFVPQFIFQIFGIDGNEPAYFLARRASMLFLGYAVVTFFLRDQEYTKANHPIVMGIAISMFGFAILGLYEFVRGYAGPGILFAMIAEIIISVSYFLMWLSNRERLAI